MNLFPGEDHGSVVLIHGKLEIRCSCFCYQKYRPSSVYEVTSWHLRWKIF